MTSFSELPCLDSLQGVSIFPEVLQTRGGNLQLSTKRENGKKSLRCKLQSSSSLSRRKRKLLNCLSHPLTGNSHHLERGQHQAHLWKETIEGKCCRMFLFNATAEQELGFLYQRKFCYFYLFFNA